MYLLVATFNTGTPSQPTVNPVHQQQMNTIVPSTTRAPLGATAATRYLNSSGGTGLKVDEPKLIANIKGNLDSAFKDFEILWESLESQIKKFVQRRTAHDTSDIVQEICNHVWQDLRDFNPRKSKFITWVKGVAKKVLKEHQVQEREFELSLREFLFLSQPDASVSDLVDDDKHGPQQQTIENTQKYKQILDNAMLSLPAFDRAIIQSRLENVSFRDIALDTARDESEIRSLYAGSVRKLRHIVHTLN